MKVLSLQPRLQLLSELVPEKAKLADIGTDHGYLPVALLLRGKITHAIASDLAIEPLEHARRTAAEYEIHNIDFRLCDGLKGIAPHEVDTITIAGMGGDTIVSILSAASWTKEGHLLLLQPMTKSEMLRYWLSVNGYIIIQERLALDKKNLYPILLVNGGESRELTPEETYSGVAIEKDPLYYQYLDKQIFRIQKAIDGLNRSNDRSRCEAALEKKVILDSLLEKRGAL